MTCSGYGRSGSIRIVKSGIGINEVASNELEGIKGTCIHTYIHIYIHIIMRERAKKSA